MSKIDLLREAIAQETNWRTQQHFTKRLSTSELIEFINEKKNSERVTGTKKPVRIDP